jgi:inorganic pyrophosphatase
MEAVPARAEESGLVNVVIDTPRGSSNKYKCDERTGLYKISRILPAGMHFPCDFGSVPQTQTLMAAHEIFSVLRTRIRRG